MKLPAEAIDLLLASLESLCIFMNLNMKGLLSAISVSLEKDSIIIVELLNRELFEVYTILKTLVYCNIFVAIQMSFTGYDKMWTLEVLDLESK